MDEELPEEAIKFESLIDYYFPFLAKFNNEFQKTGHKDFQLVSKEYLLGLPRKIVFTEKEFWVSYDYPNLSSKPIGVSRFKRDGKLIEHYTPNTIGEIIINDMEFYDNKIWFGTSEGVHIFSCISEHWELLLNNESPLNQWNVIGIQVNNDNLIFGSNSGVAHFDPFLELCTYYELDDTDTLNQDVMDICLDGNNRTWVLIDSDTNPTRYVKDGTFCNPRVNLCPYPQKMVKISEKHCAIGGSASLAIVNTQNLETAHIIDTPQGLIRGIAYLNLVSFDVIFYSVKARLFSTYIIRDNNNLILKEMLV